MSESRCPLCGAPLYGWLELPDPASRPTVGRPVEAQGARLLERCEDCGAAVEAAAAPVDLEAELDGLVRRQDGGTEVAIANRASWQASLGGEGWAAIDQRPGRLLLTPASLRLLAERTGSELGELRFPPTGRNQGWMWQTLLNGLTFHPNFAREVRAGRLRAANARSGFAFAADCVATVLAAPLVFLLAVPLELVAALARRGGEVVASLRRPSARPSSPAAEAEPAVRAGR